MDATSVLETGIKPVDFFAPIKLGGVAGIDFCLGAGIMLLGAQIMHNFVMNNNGRVVYIGSPVGPPFLHYREFFYGTGKAFRGGVSFVVTTPDHNLAEQESTVEKGFEIAKLYREAGYDVLVKLEGSLLAQGDTLGIAREHAGVSSTGSTTVLCTGGPPDGLSDAYDSLDSAIVMSPESAGIGLYPAVDVEHSRSCLFDENVFDPAHMATVRDCRQLILRCDRYNLHNAVKTLGKHFMATDDGGVSLSRVERARRLRFFLTQGYHGTEMWTGRPGETVPLSHTVETCQRILDGEYADVPEKAWYMMGRMESILERARTIED